MKKRNVRRIVKGSAALGLGALVAKLLGAFYRVPLTNIIGGKGIGLYQTVFPVYMLLLDFSGAGVPSAISKLISSKSENRQKYAYNYLITSLKLLLIVGVFGTFLMAVLAYPLGLIQGNSSVYLSYLTLCPSVVFVSLLSCFRGYFQGLMNMMPTAVSQIIEQAVKLVCGLFFVKLFMPNLQLAVAGATLAVTISEAVALIWLYYLYRRTKKSMGISFSYDKNLFLPTSKTIIKTTIPVTLIGIMIPLSHVIDSFLIVNLLNTYRTDATSLYGLLGGVTSTVINLPVAVCYGVAAVAIPTVASSKTQKEQNKNSTKTLILTLILSVPCLIICLIFAPFIINFLFKNLSQYEKQVSINLLRLTSPCIILLSLLQTGNAILIGKGRLYSPLLGLGVGVLIKTVLCVALLLNPQINIYGGGVALIACYFVACLINFILIFKKRDENAYKRTAYRRCTG